MTPHADLVARLEELASKNGCLSAAYENCIEQGASQSDMCLTCAAATAAKALAALPPPANPLYEYCPSCRRLGPLFGLTAIRSEETGGRHCIACYGKTESRLLPLWTAPPTQADPPALVALRRSLLAGLEAIRQFASPHVQHTNRCNGDDDTPCDCGAINPRDVAEALYEQVLSYPLPAAPPVTDTPRGCTPEYIASALARAYPPQIQVGDVIEFAHGNDAPMLQRVTHQAAVEDWNGKLRDRVRAIYTPKLAASAAPPDPPGLPRYGVTWQEGVSSPLLTPMADGYWTPWHLAAQAIAARQSDPPGLVANWRPIETAPKRTDVLAGWADRPHWLPQVLQQDDAGMWFNGEESDYRPPTHWMPLPASPQAKED